ncbi:hypothetical protein ACOMHN_052483 [Nucella lapillus]
MNLAIPSALWLTLLLAGVLGADNSVERLTPKCVSMCHSYNKLSSKNLCLLLMCRKAFLGYFNRFGKRADDVFGGTGIGGVLSGRIREGEAGHLVLVPQGGRSEDSEADENVRSHPQGELGNPVPSGGVEAPASPDKAGEESLKEEGNQTVDVNAVDIEAETPGGETTLSKDFNHLQETVRNSNTLNKRKPNPVLSTGFPDHSIVEKVKATIQRLLRLRILRKNLRQNDSPYPPAFSMFVHDKDQPSVDKRDFRSDQYQPSVDNRDFRSDQDQPSVDTRDFRSDQDQPSVDNRDSRSDQDQPSVDKRDFRSDQDQPSVDNRDSRSDQDQPSVDKRDFRSDHDQPSVDNRDSRSDRDTDSARSFTNLLSQGRALFPFHPGKLAPLPPPPPSASVTAWMEGKKERMNKPTPTTPNNGADESENDPIPPLNHAGSPKDEASPIQNHAGSPKDEASPIQNRVWSTGKLLTKDDNPAIEDRMSVTSGLPSQRGEDQGPSSVWKDDNSPSFLVLADYHTRVALLPATGNASDVTGKGLVGLVRKLVGGQP